MKDLIMVLKLIINFMNIWNKNYLKTVSEDYFNFKNYQRQNNKDYIPIEKREHTRKKTFVYDFNDNVTKFLGNYLLNIYRKKIYI